MNRIKIKKNDEVKILSGKDKGKIGKVTQVFISEAKVVVEGANKRFKNLKPKKQGEKGQRIEFFAPTDISNVALICKKCGRTTRIAYKVNEDNKYRLCKKCNEIID